MRSWNLLFSCVGTVSFGMVACVGDSAVITPPGLDAGDKPDTSPGADSGGDSSPGVDSGDASAPCSASQKFAWAFPSKPNANTQYVSTATVSADKDGNTLATAWYGGTAPDFGNGPLPLGGNSSWDAAVVKLDTVGALMWSIGIAGGAGDYSYGVAADPTGAVYVVGSTSSTSVSVAGVANALTTVNNQPNGFIVKLDAKGLFVWGKVFQATAGAACVSVAANATSIVVGCQFGGATAFVAGMPNLKVTGADINGQTSDQAVIVFDPSGVVQWMRRIGGAGNDAMGGVAIDPAGTVLVGGTINSNNPMFVDTAAGSTSVPRVGTSSNASLIWIDPMGTLSRSQVFGNPNTSVNQSAASSDVAFDGDGNGYFTGTYRGAMDIKGNTLNSSTGNKTCASGTMPPCTDVFLAKIDKSTGAALFTKSFGGTNDESATNVKVNGCNVVVSGINRSVNVSVDGLPIDSPAAEITNQGPWAMYAASFDTGGKAQWAKGLVSADPNAAISAGGIGFTSTGGLRIGLGVQGDVKLDGTNVYSAGVSGQRFIVWGLQR